MEKREWVYIQNPKEYGCSCDKCGGVNIQWSEFAHMIWCYDCKIDTQGNQGVFDGPIPVQAAHLLGMCFTRIRLDDGEILEDLCCGVHDVEAIQEGSTKDSRCR